MIELPRAPLDDPAYRPAHPPVNGQIPPVVRRWGPRSQIRWFTRFGDRLDGLWWPRVAGLFYVSSDAHRGYCCQPCERVWRHEWIYQRGMTGLCCCKAGREHPA